MDESKRPVGFVPEPDLQDIEPLQYYEVDKPEQSSRQTPQRTPGNRRPLGRSHPRSITQSDRREFRTSGSNEHSSRAGSHSEPHSSGRYQAGRHTIGRT